MTTYATFAGEFDTVAKYERLFTNNTYAMKFDIWDRDNGVRTAHTKVSGEVFRLRSKPLTGAAAFTANVLLTDSSNRWSGNVQWPSAALATALVALPCEVYVDLVQVLTASVDATTPSGYVERVLLHWKAWVQVGDRT